MQSQKALIANANGQHMNRQLACKLTTPALQTRRATVIADLKSVLINKQIIDDGLVFTFPSHDQVLVQLIDFIKSERVCCDFLSFKLTISADNADNATLEITGPPGTQAFLEQEVGF